MPREADGIPIVIVEVRKDRKTLVKSEEALRGRETFRNLLSRQVPHGVTIGDSDSWKVLDGFCRRQLDDKVPYNGAHKVVLF